MKKICIYGAGGFAKEVYWLAQMCGYDVDAFIDIQAGGYCCGKPIQDDNYFDRFKHLAVVGVGNPKVREKIVNNIILNHGEDVFVTLVSPNAVITDPGVNVGYGSVVCANCVLTCDITLGSWSQLNLSTTIGHDTTTGPFFTTAPGVHVSGKVNAGKGVYFGTNASVIEEIKITDYVTIGAASCVTKDILESGTYVGVPAKKLEKKMADTIGSLIDKLATVNQKMFMVQEELYVIRRMSLEEFKASYGTDEGLAKLHVAFKKSMDLNVQRQAMILEVDKKIAEVIGAAVKGEDLDNGKFIQDQHKTY